MFRIFVSGGSFGGAIGFHEDEPRRFILLLNDVEARDARFFDALPRIFERNLFEPFNGLFFDPDVNVHHEHEIPFVLPPS